MFVTLTLGRGQLADIKLEDDSVSRIHAEITRSDKGHYYLIDCNSTRGTYMKQNNAWQPHNQGYVNEQNVLKVGEFEVAMALVVDHFENFVNLNSHSDQVNQKQSSDCKAADVDLEPLSIRPRRNQSTGQIELD